MSRAPVPSRALGSSRHSGPTGFLQAVLLDMDGTLVDTEPYWIAAEYALVEEFGGTWSDEHAHALVGNALPASGAYIREHGPVPLTAEQIVERLLDQVVAAVADVMPWRRGARELVAGLFEANIPCALVTMSYTSLADAMVRQLPAGSFAAVVTGDQVRHGKPHPEAYQTAAALLGVHPRDCVAIEDSPTGVASAEAAGCAVIAVPHNVPIAPAPTRTLLTSLVGLSVADLDTVARRHQTSR